MRYISIDLPPNLPRNWSKVYHGRTAALANKGNHQLRSEYLRKTASWSLLKSWLSRLSFEKCWYCEAKSPRSPFDVDHFRPKLAVTVDGDALVDYFGYYWLAYEWWNFRLSCQRCNRPEYVDHTTRRGKWNEFPIRLEGARCAPVSIAIEDEAPRFLDPCVEADCKLLAYGLDGVIRPSSETGSWENERAQYTIDQLGLNDWNVPEDRKKAWQTLTLVIEHVPLSVAEACVKGYLGKDQEYLAFFRSVIGSHRDKEWIEALL